VVVDDVLEEVTMPTPPAPRLTVLARKTGYLISAGVNAFLAVLVNYRPGWVVLPFLTASFVEVLWLINLTLIAGVATNLAYVAYEPAWFTSVGKLVVTAIGLAAAVSLFRVFPFGFMAYTFEWAVVVRVLLVLAVIGSIVAILIELVWLVGGGARIHDHRQHPSHP